MYDILFVDDKFKEIQPTYSDFQSKHIRCFYSDGENYLPDNDEQRLPFKNLKYISLDLHLENRGITQVKGNKTALSTLASIIQSFVNNGENLTIIANTSFPDDFDETEFFKYLNFDINPIIEKKEKYGMASSLHEDANNISENAHQETLRNIIIREAIEIENLIYTKTQENFEKIVPKLSSNQLKRIKDFRFSSKIQLYKLALNDDSNNLNTKLNELRDLRNKFAHDDNPPQKDLLEFLQEVEDIRKTIEET